MDTDNQRKTNGHAHISDASARVRDDAKALAASMTDFTSLARDTVFRAMDEKPYVAIGAAFGFGYLLAGGLRSKLTGLMVTLAGRYLLNNLKSQLLEQVRR